MRVARGGCVAKAPDVLSMVIDDVLSMVIDVLTSSLRTCRAMLF